jgi:hypothetical protein
MKKLKLESIEVTSFETCAGTPPEHGTVHGRDAKPVPPLTLQCQTTPEMDCTYGCSMFTGCVGGCGFTHDADCVPTSFC